MANDTKVQAVQTNMKKKSPTINSHQESTALTTVFVVWSFFMLCRPQDYLPFLGYLRPGLTLALAALFIWFFSTKSREKKIPSDNQLKLYRYLVLVMALSIPFSYYRSASLKELIQYGTVVLFVFLFYRIMNSAEKIRRLLFVYCVGVTAYGLSILTQGSVAEGRISFGNVFDPNDIAYYMISFIAFNVFFISRDNSGLVRLISMASILLGLLIIIKTGSRGGFIALMSVLAFFLFNRSAVFNPSFLRKVLLVLSAIIALHFIDLDYGRFRTILDYKNDYNATGEEGRIAIWKNGLKMMATHPLTGVGFNRFPEGLGRDREARGLESTKWQTAHNSLVQIGAETGIFGFMLFLVLSMNAYRIFSVTAREAGDTGLAKLGKLAQAGFIGHFIAAMFLSQAYSVYWVFYIVLSATLNRLRSEEDETVPFDSSSVVAIPVSSKTRGREVYSM